MSKSNVGQKRTYRPIGYESSPNLSSDEVDYLRELERRALVKQRREAKRTHSLIDHPSGDRR